MPPIINEIFGFLGFLLSALGLLVVGFAGGRFALDAFKSSAWQVQVALVLAFFGTLVGIANYTSAGSTGAFALGAGIAFLISMMPKKKDGGESDAK